MKKLSRDTIKYIFNGFSSVTTACVLVLSLFAVHATNVEGPYFKFFPLFFGGCFLFLALSRIPLIIISIKSDPNKIAMYRNIVLASLYLVLAVLVLVYYNHWPVYGLLSGLFLFSISGGRCSMCFEKRRRKIAKIIINGILSTISLCLGIIVVSSIEYFELYIIAVLGIIFLVSLFDTMAFAFSQMQLKGLLKIMHKTYAFEVLYGLIVLIVSFSVFFMLNEEAIKSYGDALWYSFATVTTIGFGDFTVVSTTSRILSVILGLYGIIVVAVITSVIVNYYNEVKDKKDSENEKDDESENEPKPEEEKKPDSGDNKED